MMARLFLVSANLFSAFALHVNCIAAGSVGAVLPPVLRLHLAVSKSHIAARAHMSGSTAGRPSPSRLAFLAASSPGLAPARALSISRRLSQSSATLPARSVWAGRRRVRQRLSATAGAAAPPASVSVLSAVEGALARAARVQPSVAAFTTIDAEAARAAAEDVATRRTTLNGAPVVIKDNICTRGIATTGGSRILENYIPPYSATAVLRLEAAGGVVLGKANMDEYGMGSSTENSAYGLTRNPWNLDHVPGGSSGGSAAAVAAGVCDLALGSDTGGSIRQPASFCGVTGLKPSYGRVSRHGLLAYASSLDTIGPITRTVTDAARVLQIIAGHDPYDSTSVTAPVPDYCAALADPDVADLSGVVVGVIGETMGDGVDPEVVEAVRAAAATMERLGASVREVSLPRVSSATPAYYILATSEASANLARYDGIRYGVRDYEATTAADIYSMSRSTGLGGEVKRRIMLGTFALSTGYYDDYYLRAQRVRNLVVQDYRRLFKSGIDVLLSPVCPTPAFKFGEKVEDPIAMIVDDLMTIPANLAGLPALSVPCGHSQAGLPIGLHIVGPYLDELNVLRVGHAFQTSTEHHIRLSPIAQTLLQDKQ
jgi:aspartyl-tRNA(Asn)/glutamyl-tRNA(Gln) amidotransferase subunit A